jgi:glycosyltransferase involved in cell wall biosynthesis
MNIIFFNLQSFGGGVEVVSVCLANKFIHEGHSVHIVTFENWGTYFLDKLDSKIQTTALSWPILSLKNMRIMNAIFQNEKTDIVINQRGENIFVALLLKLTKTKSQVKVVSLYHNQPGVNTHIASINTKILKLKLNFIQKSFLELERIIMAKLVAWNMKIAYLFSDRYILLSESYIDVFCKLVDISNHSKVGVIPNPVTIITHSNNSEIIKKKKIIYAARLVKYPKHPERIIELWEIIRTQVPEWSLEILGEGVERTNLEIYCNEKNIDRVDFLGFVDPGPYYAEASILLLASDYEGFPLVIAEAMHYGIVPIVYQSFAALTDIITDNRDGLIVKPDENGQYSKVEMIKKVLSLINDEKLLKELSINAQESSKYFSLENIYQKWISLFRNF